MKLVLLIFKESLFVASQLNMYPKFSLIEDSNVSRLLLEQNRLVSSAKI